MKTIPQSIIKAAQDEQAKWWVPASVSIAQWALESNFGASMPAGSNNPFGIKAVAGEASVVTATHEEVNGVMIATSAGFAKFPSIEAAFEAHGKLLHTNPRYSAAMKARMNADDFANALTGVYATDRSYGAKLISLMKAYNLYAYNDLSKGPAMVDAPTPAVLPRTTGTTAAVWLNGLGAFLSMLAGFTQYLPPQYAAAGVVITGINGVLHQMTGNAGSPNPFQ